MNILKNIVWIVVVGVIIWIGYIFINKKSSIPAASEQGASVVETLGGEQAPAPESESTTPPPAPAPAVTPPPAPAPATTPPPAPIPTY